MRFVRPALTTLLAWVAIAELFAGDVFLGVNTVLAALYVLVEPLLRAAEGDASAPAPVAMSPATVSQHGVVGADAVPTSAVR